MAPGLPQSRLVLCEKRRLFVARVRATLQVLELMGGEHAGLSQEAKGLYNPQIMGSASPDTPESSEEQ